MTINVKWILRLSISLAAVIVVTSQKSIAMNTTEKAVHVLNRFAYGPKLGEAEKLAQTGDKGLADWFKQQMNPKTEAKLEEKLKKLSSLKYTNQQMLAAFPKQNEKTMLGLDPDKIEGDPKDILKELVIQKIVRSVESENQFEEVLVDFWFNHFNVYFDKGAVRHAVTSYERDVIRPHVFGNFKDMLMATAKSPAMLFYLDNHKSRKGQINENYARELLELHTLGVDAGYTQRDIQETARVLTGWSIQKAYQISDFRFLKNQHDKDPKTVLDLEFKKNEGIKEGERLIEYLALHPSTAKFISKKLAVKFISDSPSKESVNKLADIFIKSRGNLKEVYLALFQLDEFWKSENIKIKTPFEYFISSVRILNASIIPDTEKINIVKRFFDQSGQSLYRCQPPTGFKATADFWVNPGAMVNRINLALKLSDDQIPQVSFDKNNILNPIKNNKYRNQDELVQYFNKNVFNSIIHKKTLAKLDQLVNESEQYQQDSRKELPIYYFKTEKILALMLSTPEFQRR